VILSAFLVGLALSLVGIVVGSVRGVSLWRQGKRTGRAMTSELAQFEER
jgi:VIT1/CCC1 family predicted Fe2+/Mn2+ transporter